MKRRQFLAGAAALAAAPRTRAQARPGPVALVLGGGGCRGYGHIGVLRVLEKQGFKPDLVVGSSVGALVGAFYAAGMSADEIERYGDRMTPNMLRGWIFPRLGFFSGSGIRSFVSEHIGEKAIESLPTRFAAIATDLLSGSIKVLDRGDLGLAVQASASAPGLLEPVRLDGRPYVDGNLSAPVPVDAARRLGATRVVAVDVTFPPEQADLNDPFDALYQGFSILTRKLAEEERSRADVLLLPPIPEHNDMKASTLKSIVAAGERAATDALPALTRLFAR
jgi:NTE family protein